jgi:hypothetical protein
MKALKPPDKGRSEAPARLQISDLKKVPWGLAGEWAAYHIERAGVDCEAAPTQTPDPESRHGSARMERRRAMNQAILAAPTSLNALFAARRHNWCYRMADSFPDRLIRRPINIKLCRAAPD